ncbi:MAG: glycosyltransferase family 39 protein [Anaerolineales bacterium]
MSLANANQLTGKPTAISRVVTAIGIRDLSAGIWVKLAAITGAGLAVRLFGLGQQGLWFDEAYSIFVAKLPLAFSMEVLIADGVHPPLYYLIQRIALPLGEGEIAVRLPAIFFGLLAVPLMFLLGNLWAGERTGLIAAALIVLSPFHIWYSQEARMYSTLMALSIMSMFAYTRLLHTGRHRGTEVVFVLASGLAYLTHYFALFLALIQLAHIAVNFKRQHGLLARWLVLQLLAAIPLLLWLYLIYLQPQVIVGIGWIEVPQPIDLWYTLVNFSLGFVEQGDILRGAGAILFSGLAIAGARTRWRLDLVASLVVMWALLPLVLTFLISLKRPMYVDRFLILSLPAFVLLVAKGLDSMRRQVRLAAGSVVLLLSIYGIVTFVFGPAQQKEDWRGAAEYLSRAAADEALVVRTLQMVIPLAYYHPDYKSFQVIEVNRDITPISQYAAGHKGTWLLYWNPASSSHSVAATTTLNNKDETDPELASWMAGQGPEILERVDFRGLTIFHFNDFAPEL